MRDIPEPPIPEGIRSILKFRDNPELLAAARRTEEVLFNFSELRVWGHRSQARWEIPGWPGNTEALARSLLPFGAALEG